MTGVTRQAQIGLPVPLPRSNYTQERVYPVKGYSDQPDIPSGPDNIIDGQNAWIWQERVTPRPRLQAIAQNVLNDVPVGAFTYFEVGGIADPMLFSRSTAAYLSQGTWSALSYVPSGASFNPPSGGIGDPIFGTSTYLSRADTNIAVWVNGLDPAFAWGGPANGTTYSTLTQGYIAADVTVANDRLIYWNVGYLSSSSRLVQRVAWTASGNPEDTTGPDAGYQDLLDMRGVGTRTFTIADQLVVATDQEIWRGTFIGPPYVYQFTPLSRTQGIPFPKAAINTPEGLFWLGSDFMIYNIQPFYWYSKIDPVGFPVQRTFHDQMADPTTAFFGYHGDAKMLTLYYTDTAGSYPQRGMTYNTISKVWTPQVFAQNLAIGFSAQQSSSATTWDALVGTFAAQALTYNQLLGASAVGSSEAVASSTGTAYSFIHSALQATDDGVPVLTSSTFGQLFSALPERRKFLDEVRLDVQADISSTLSVAISGDAGQTFPVETAVTVSVASTSSQVRVKSAGISGAYHNVRLRSTGGSWNVVTITARSKVEGEAI